MRLFFIAGEASGDRRAAEVMEALNALAAERGVRIKYYGLGGPRMKALAPDIEDWHEEAVMGVWEVIKKYGYFRKKFHETLDKIARVQPDAVVTVDYPGFNLRLAKALAQRRDPAKRVHYISPQVWAWHRGRIPKIAKTLDGMLCLFPFEKELYENSGLKTVFVGHPLLDTLAPEKGREPREENLIALFPGSRKKEIAKIFPLMLQTAALMRKEKPELQFEVAAANETLAAALCVMAAGTDIQVRPGHAYSLMNRAAAGIVKSGTTTLEAALMGMPHILVYKVAMVTGWLGKLLIRIPFVGIANIIAGRPIVHEFLQGNARPAAMAEEMLALLDNPEKQAAMRQDFRAVAQALGDGGAAKRAAAAIWEAVHK